MSFHNNSSYDETQGRELELPFIDTAFADPSARFRASAVFVDINESTAMKAVWAPTHWGTVLAHFYKLCQGHASDPLHPMPHLKFLGDGLLAIFHSSDTTRAITFAIAIQESLRQATSPKQGQTTGEVDYSVSIGIANGEVVRFRGHDGGIDHVGPAIDLAARFSSVANPKAILVERNAIFAAKMDDVSSPLGVSAFRQVCEYPGEVQQIRVKGRDDAQQYHEILWASQLYGVKSEAATVATAWTPPPTVTMPANQPTPFRQKPVVGKVLMWNNERGYGFVENTTTGEQFHVTRRSLCFSEDAEEIRPGAHLGFMEGPTTRTAGETDGRKRKAHAVLVIGRPAEGRVVKAAHDKGFGFINVPNESGAEISVFMPITDQNKWVRVGMEVGFDVGEGPRGLRADNVDRLEGEADTAA